MQHYLYTLCFDAPVHFGMAERGGGLEHTDMVMTADALFSAILAELSAAGEHDALCELLDAVRQGILRISDLLPWREREDGAWDFYLPRPVLPEDMAAQTRPDSYAEACAFMSAHKQQKRLSYIRAGRMQEYLESLREGRPFDEPAAFGQEILHQRVNCRGEESLPYFVGSFVFHEQAGLYLIVSTESEDMVEAMSRLLEFMGQSGIGGKRSSGYGKFHLADDAVLLSEDAVYGEDDAALYRLLTDEAAEWQMTLSPVLPDAHDIEAVAQGFYHLRHVGGFVTTAALAEKKNSICLLDSGSCLRERVPGSMASLGQNEGHPVLRYGYGLYVGLGGIRKG